MVAQGRFDDVVAEVHEQVRCPWAGPAAREALADLRDAARADPARDRLAARLVGAERASAAAPGRRCMPARPRRRRSRTRRGRRPRAAARTSYGVVERGRRQQAARWARRRARPSPAGRPTPPASCTISSSVVPVGTSAMPPRTAPLTWTSDRARRVGGADRGERAAARWQDPRHGQQRRDVVDDRRLAEQAALGRMRRALLGLAALALERLQQDRLLAQHVGALDGPDRDVRGRSRRRARRRRGSPRPRAATTAASSRRTASV